jgi:putative zinc ribbon protein
MIMSTMSSTRHEDRQLVCHLCGETFIFSAGEQELQRVRGVNAEPTRKRRPPTVPYLPRVTRAH